MNYHCMPEPGSGTAAVTKDPAWRRDYIQLLASSTHDPLIEAGTE